MRLSSMHFLFNRQYIITVLRYALVLGVSVVLFALLKKVLYISYGSWDTYAAIVAVLFLGGGIWLGRLYTLDETPVPPSVGDGRANPADLLSRRETEVATLLVQNKTNQQIADELCIELSTLKTHINKIYKKLGIKNRRQLQAVMK